MVARVGIFNGAPDQLEDAIRRGRKQTLPALQRLFGFAGLYVLAERQTGNTVGITLWETEAALRAWERGLQGRDRRGCAEDPPAAAALFIEDREDLSQALQFASGNGSALRPSARQASDGSVLPSRQAFQALMAMATSASRPDSVEY